MSRIRIVLMAIAVLALATTASAQFCESCGANGVCFSDPGSGRFCMQWIDYCEEWGGCGRSNEPQEFAIAAEWTIASVEVVTPAGRQLEVKDQAVQTAQVVPNQVE